MNYSHLHGQNGARDCRKALCKEKKKNNRGTQFSFVEACLYNAIYDLYIS